MIRGITITSVFQKTKHDMGRSRQRVLQWINEATNAWHRIATYSTHNKGKSVVAGRFIRTLKTEIYKHMAAVSKNVYIQKLDEVVNPFMTETVII